MLVVDRDGIVRMVNRAVEAAIGLRRDDCARPIWELTDLPVERDLLKAGFPCRPEAFPSGLLFHLTSSAGPSRVVDWDVRILEDAPELAAPPAMILTGVDVTDRLHSQLRLRETEAFQRQVLDRLPAIVWTTDNDLRTTFSAGGGLSTLGLASGEVALMGTPISSYFQTDDPTHPGIASHLRALRGELCIFEMSWFNRLYQARLEPLRDDEGKIVGVIGLAFDTTEQTRTAQALRESEAHLRRLVDANVIGIFFWEESGRLSDANEAFLQLIGFSREELLSGNVSWRKLTAPEHRHLDDRALEELRTTGRCAPYEKAYVAKSGARVPVMVGGAAFEGWARRAGASTAGWKGRRSSSTCASRCGCSRCAIELLLKEQAARRETELANARLQLLVEGSKRLSRTMNPNETLKALAEVVVPGLADWSYVIHRGWNGGPSMIASAAGDPNKKPLLGELEGCIPDANASEGAPRVFRTGDIAVYSNITDEDLMPDTAGRTIVGTRDPVDLHTLRELGMRSLLCAPITGRNGVDAVMMLVSSRDPERYGAEDVVLARDLASRAAVSLENARLLFEALDAVRMRDDFLAVAAHELRTPLTSLLLQVQLLERALRSDGRDRPEVAATAIKGVSAAQKQARRLSVLVDGLLDVARLASNRMSLRVEELDLRELIDGALAAMAPDFQRAGCKVTLTVPPKVVVNWDRVRIEQVVTNLLSNAIKFGAGRPIEVRVEASASSVQIAVRDHGMGIATEDQERIFGRFERAVSTRHFGGLGLGLYISMQILRAHHGSMRVESQPGQGACFIVDLPPGLLPAPLMPDIAAGLSP